MWTRIGPDCFLELYDITNYKQHNFIKKKKTQAKQQSSAAIEISGKLFLNFKVCVCVCAH